MATLSRFMPSFLQAGRTKILSQIGYALFFLACLLVFAYWTFPYERLRDYIVQEVEYPMGPTGRRQASGYELQIVDLSPSFFTGVTLSGVHLSKPALEPDASPFDLLIDEATIRVSLLSLLFGTTSLSFDASLAGGEVEGDYSQSGDETELDVELDEIQFRRLGVIRSALGLPVSGTAGGAIELQLAEEASETSGAIELDITGVELGDGKAKLKLPGMSDGVTVDKIRAGTLTLRATAEEGNAKVEQLSAKGPDVEIDGSGTIRLSRQIKATRLDLLVRSKFNDSYKEKSDRTRALFSLLEFNPQTRLARTPDGSMQFRVSGSFGGSIRAVPAGRAPTSRR